MSHISLPTRRRVDRCRPILERLESRLTLDSSVGTVTLTAPLVIPADVGATLGPDLTPLSTVPANGASVTTPPSSISVTFDRPLDPFWLLGNDILVETQQGGVWTPLYSFFNSPTERLDATGTVLTLTLPTSLTPGTYQLVLPECSFLTGLDGSMVADLGSDQVLSTFTRQITTARPP